MPLRVLLGTLAALGLVVGVAASAAPLWFYDTFPWLTTWVAKLPPYNEHLVSDHGGLSLGFGLLFAWAAYRPSRQLVLPLCWTYAISQLLHFLFHVTHLEGFSTADAIAQTITLASAWIVPLVAIWLLAPQPMGRVQTSAIEGS